MREIKNSKGRKQKFWIFKDSKLWKEKYIYIVWDMTRRIEIQGAESIRRSFCTERDDHKIPDGRNV